MNHTMKVVNLFAGPGAGKSTIMAGLFYLMKANRWSCEFAPEYAKDLVWENRQQTLQDQLYVTAHQNRRLERLKGQVDWVITDSPILLGVHYALPDYFPNHFRNLVFEVFSQYENVNFFIERPQGYETKGRNETLEQAKQVDRQIIDMMHRNKINYISIQNRQQAPYQIFDILKKFK